MLFADLLSLHLITFFKFFLLLVWYVKKYIYLNKIYRQPATLHSSSFIDYSMVICSLAQSLTLGRLLMLNTNCFS